RSATSASSSSSKISWAILSTWSPTRRCARSCAPSSRKKPSMSDATAAGEREWRFYIDDMIAFAEKVTAYSAGMDQERFIASGINYDATLRNLELIGEAATHVPEAVRASHPQVPWRLVIATRNRLIHGYLG